MIIKKDIKNVEEYPNLEKQIGRLSDEELFKYHESKSQVVKDSNQSPNFSRNSKAIGDIGERVVFDFLKKR